MYPQITSPNIKQDARGLGDTSQSIDISGALNFLGDTTGGSGLNPGNGTPSQALTFPYVSGGYPSAGGTQPSSIDLTNAFQFLTNINPAATSGQPATPSILDQFIRWIQANPTLAVLGGVLILAIAANPGGRR